ncbi:MAG: hypothetical protein WCA81_02685 [Rhizomicrobium sp.]
MSWTSNLNLSAILLAATLVAPTASSRADSCPANSHPVSEADNVVHCRCDKGYQNSGGACQIDCDAVEQNAAQEKAAIEQLRDSNQRNQQELSDWTGMSRSAQKDALQAALEWAGAAYASDADSAAASVSKLEEHIAFLTKKNVVSKKQATRLRYLAELQQARTALTTKLGIDRRLVVWSKKFADLAVSADDAWYVARPTMQAEFRVAAKRDAGIREQLKDKKFREVFSGDPSDSPAMETIETLSDQAIEDVSKALLTAEQFKNAAGPGVRAGIFVRDAWYSALESYFSKQRVEQDSEVAGKMARAIGTMQKQYQETIDAVKECRALGR